MLTDTGEIVQVGYTFKKAMKVLSLQRDGDIEGVMKELRLSYEDSLSFLKDVSVERWVSPKASRYDVFDLTDEEKHLLYEHEKVFDYLHDFDAYYSDFREYFNIDLLRDDISFLEFTWLLNSVCSKEQSAIASRMRYRSYEKDKNDSHKYSSAMMDMKATYALTPIDNSQLIYESMKKGGNVIG